jgi:hypothetical protein
MKNLFHIVDHFTTDGLIRSIEPFGSGHINDTYLVTTFGESQEAYVLQKINHHIFKNVPQLMDNIMRVTTHIRGKLQAGSLPVNDFRVFQVIRSKTGGCFFKDEEGQYWRLIEFICDSKSYNLVESPELAFEAGKAFGLFQMATSGMDAGSLFEVLPNFHDIDFRLENFRNAVIKNPVNRVEDISREIDFVETRSGEMHTIKRLGKLGQIPMRATHNDTKFNNVLFNHENRAVSVVDLDTVMPGYSLYDFGDAIRTGASTGAEDEADLSKVSIDLKLFESYSRGYLGITRNFLNRDEIGHLAFSAKFMTWLIGLRFLTDHIDGDRYFKTGFPGHNLQRARAQFRLLERMEHHFKEMQEMIDFIAYFA